MRRALALVATLVHRVELGAVCVLNSGSERISMRTILTYKDYEALPADGRRYEVHEGELSAPPAPSPRHQQVTRNLAIALHEHVKGRGLGEVLFSPIDCIRPS